MPFPYDLCQRHISIMTSFKIFIPLSPFSEAHTSLALPAPRLLLLGARPTVNFRAEQAVNLLNGWRSYEILESWWGSVGDPLNSEYNSHDFIFKIVDSMESYVYLKSEEQSSSASRKWLVPSIRHNLQLANYFPKYFWKGKELDENSHFPSLLDSFNCCKENVSDSMTCNKSWDIVCCSWRWTAFCVLPLLVGVS